MGGIPGIGGRTLTFLGGAVAVAVATVTITAAPAAAADPMWKIMQTYDHPRSQHDAVEGVIAVSASNAWAFSGTDSRRRTSSRPLIHRWDGTAWTSQTLPYGIDGTVFGGDHSSPTNVWAFGGLPNEQTYALRWDGATWSKVREWTEGQITDIQVINSRDVWVFGGRRYDEGVGTWHFDGNGWRRFTTPFRFWVGDKVSSTDVWAVGDLTDGSGQWRVGRWNGLSWRTVSTGSAVPTAFTGGFGAPFRDVRLTDVLARSASDVWVTGAVTTGVAGTFPSRTRPLLIHWDGRTWTSVAVPESGTLENITSDGTGGLWFTSELNSGTSVDQRILRRTADGTWKVVPVAGTTRIRTWFRDLALVPRTDRMFGVGTVGPSDDSFSRGAIFNYPFVPPA